jgi:hypothetical protein
MAAFAAVAIVSAVAGGVSSVMASKAKKKAARKAAEEAKRQREWYEKQARQTHGALQREIDSVKLLRDMDMPAYKQAQQVALIQQRKGVERAVRNRGVAGLGEDVRGAVFGGQTQQYLARETQRMEHYSSLTKDIFQMASEQQRQTNAMLSQGGEAYGRGMATSMQMNYEAGDPTAQVLGSLAQAGSMYASQGMAKQSQQAAMKQQHANNKELMAMQLDADVFGGNDWQGRTRNFGNYA